MEKLYGLNDKKRLPPLTAYLFLILIYISTFRVFATLPFLNLHQVISTTAIIVFTAYYILTMLLNIRRNRITRIDIVMWLFILVNFMTAYRGNVVFGQPYYYGIMAQRTVLLSLSGILVITFLYNGFLTISQVEKSFVFVSVALLLISYFFFLFVDPALFSNNEFVAYSPLRGYRYRFQFALVIMLLFYSLFKISRERKNYYYIIVALILFYLVYFLQSRTTLVVLAITLVIYFYRNFTVKERVKKFILYGSILLAVTAVLLTLGYTSLLEKYQVLFHNVIDAFSDQSTDEASSAVRFKEYHTALEYIRKNPLLGNGFISNQWKGGWEEVLGYFYPVDIGILGNIFVFGFVGTIFIYMPFVYSLGMARKVVSQNVFFKTCEYMLLFFFFNMFFSAVNIRDSSSMMFLVCIIYFYRFYYQRVNERNDLIPAVA